MQDPLEKEMAGILEGRKERRKYSGILAWRIPQTEEPGGLQSKESQRVRHDLATEHSTGIFPVSSFRLLNNNNNNKMASKPF